VHPRHLVWPLQPVVALPLCHHPQRPGVVQRCVVLVSHCHLPPATGLLSAFPSGLHLPTASRDRQVVHAVPCQLRCCAAEESLPDGAARACASPESASPERAWAVTEPGTPRKCQGHRFVRRETPRVKHACLRYSVSSPPYLCNSCGGRTPLGVMTALTSAGGVMSKAG